MVCDHGLRPPRLSWQIWVIPVRGFVMTTSSAQPAETPPTTIRARYRSIGVCPTRFPSERGAASSKKCEFGFIDGPLIGRTNGSFRACHEGSLVGSIQPRLRFARDSPLEGDGFELVWGFSCQAVVLGCADSFLFGAGRPFFVPSPAIRFPERAEGVKGPKR